MVAASNNSSPSGFTLFGLKSREVIKRIWARKISPTNGSRLGLIIEGGGMRSIIAGGMLVALHRLELISIFDVVYGSSAGAVAGAYFLSRQSPYGISLYYENLNNRKFINLFPPMINIDYLIEMMVHKKKLDIAAVHETKTKLVISATDTESGIAHYFTNHDNVSLLLALNATCALPVFYDKPVKINDNTYLDGGIINMLPVAKAIEDRCTDILVLLTKPRIRTHHPLVPPWFERRRLKRYGPNFVAAYYSRDTHYRNALRIIDGEMSQNSSVNIAVIAPMQQDIFFHTINTHKLKSAYYHSYHYTLNLFQSLAPHAP